MDLKETILGLYKPIIGVVHLKPLPGSPRYRDCFEDILDRALSDAVNLVENGVDAIIIENYGDKPFAIRVRDPETIAAYSIIAWEIKKHIDRPIGLSLLRNSGAEAMAIAYVVGADFIRVNALAEPVWSPEGILLPIARDIWLKKSVLKCKTQIFGDVNVKHGKPILELDEAVKEAIDRGLADAIVVTGSRTGLPPEPAIVKYVKKLSGKPVIVGSGITVDNIRVYWDIADGFIIGTYFKKKHIIEEPVDPNNVKALIDIIKKLRSK